MRDPRLPRLALWIVERATPARDRDAVIGDLIEDFHQLSASDPAAARRWCRRQALRSVIPGLRRQYGDGLPDMSKGRFSMRGFARDVAFGLRLLRQQPLMAVAGMLSLAVGLGLNVLLFTLANAILYRPLPVSGADRLVMVQMQHQRGVAMGFSYPAYMHLRDASADVFDTFVAYGPASVSARVGNGAAEALEGEYVSGNFFTDLGVPMAAGRQLSSSDDRSEMPPVMVVSSAFWRAHFGNTPLSGQAVLMNETYFTVVGVAHATFFGTEIGRVADFWVPIGQMFAVEREDYRNKPTMSWLSLMGRLKPGRTREGAEAQLGPIATAFFEKHGFGTQKLVLAQGSQGNSDLPRNIGEPLRLLLAASLFVLLIACVNVANLQLARTAARGQELAVRAALGAGRGRLISLLLADAVILTVPAGLVAFATAALWKGSAAGLIARYGDPVTLAAPIDLRVAGVALVMTLSAALVVGGISAWLSTRRAPSLALAEGGRAGIGGAAKTQRALVIVQFALSMTLIAGAALLVRTVNELRGADLGFSRNLVLVHVAPGQRGYSRERLGRYYADAFEKVRQVPGVESAAIAHVMPLDFGGSRQGIAVAGYTPQADEGMELNTLRVSPGYFDVLGIPLVAGREFDERDTPSQPTRIIVNETMAKRYWPQGQAVGRLVRLGPQRAGRPPFDVEVIGVAADVRYRMVRENPRPTFYISTSQAPIGFFVVHARTSGSPEARLGEIERAVAAVDPGVPVARAFTLNGQLDRNIATERMARSIAMALGIAALILAATGLYATMAFSVRRRTREIGVRMALGARTSDVSRMVVGQGLVLVALGTAAGAAGAFWAGQMIESHLYGVSSADAASFAAAAGVLAAAALLATWIPARRATHVDPVIALRDQ